LILLGTLDEGPGNHFPKQSLNLFWGALNNPSQTEAHVTKCRARNPVLACAAFSPDGLLVGLEQALD
jgi:hypothetical protein